MCSDRNIEIVTPELLRGWGLPDAGESKYSRGQVLVVGGDARSPGAAILGGLAALRVGAGRLTLAVAESVAPHVAVSLPECGVVPLGETTAGHIDGAAVAATASAELERADAVLLGPGLDDIDESVALLEGTAGALRAVTVLDAFALGALSRAPEVRDRIRGPVVLTPNPDEAALLLGREPGELGELADACAHIARDYNAVVSCHGVIAEPGGGMWRLGTGGGGLGTSGSGDVLSGAAAGFCARGVDLARAAVWASYAHAVAGDRLAVHVGALGYLASELLGELPRVLVEVGANG